MHAVGAATVAALSLGKHVFVEKPLTHSIEEFLALAQVDDPAAGAHRHFGLVVDDRAAVRRACQEAGVELEDGRKANELRKLKVYEFSFVPIGANQDTSVVAVKALADAAAAECKAGRVLAQKHIDSLRSAQEAIGAVIEAAEATNDQEKASGTRKANDEEPGGAKSEEPNGSPSAKTLAEDFELQLLLEA